MLLLGGILTGERFGSLESDGTHFSFSLLENLRSITVGSKVVALQTSRAV